VPGERRRPHRVAEGIREEVATFLRDHARDPRLVGFVTITGVEVSNDLRNAKVFVSIMGTDTERATTFEGLESLASHLRAHLGRVLRLRLAPEILFRVDESIAHAARIETLLAKIKEDDAAPRGDDPPAER
jgi:ribosome-binding factor A